MTELRRHLLKCYECKGALKAHSELCAIGNRLTASAAIEFNGVIDQRRDAMRNGNGTIFACPDISKHGEAYALSAPLFYVTGVQEELS